MPAEHLQTVKDAVFALGAGKIGAYQHCAWQVSGKGQFMPLAGADPFSGTQGQLSQVEELRLEFVCPDHLIDSVISAMVAAHPYEEPAYGAIPLYTHLSKNQPVPRQGQGQAHDDVHLTEIGQLYSLAAFYDEMNQDFLDDVVFYTKLLSGLKGPVLELGCGNARVGRALAAKGLDVWGLDLVPEILALARQKAEQEGLKLTLVQANMSNFDLLGQDNNRQKFAAIICPLNTLSHLLNEAELLSCFASVKDHLLPGGIFVPSIFVPEQTGLDGDGQSLTCIENFYSQSAEETIEVYQKSRYNPISQIKELTWYFSGQKSESTWDRNFALRMYYPAEFRQLAKQAGFAIKEEWADYDIKDEQASTEPLPADCVMQSIVFVCDNRLGLELGANKGGA